MHVQGTALTRLASGNIEASLANYLANKGKWNASCRLWFEEADAELGSVSEEDDTE